MNSQVLLQHIELLREKIDTGKLIVFVGAGVSKNVEGMPDWNHLVRKMADAIDYSRCSSCWHKTDTCQETCVFQFDYTPDELLKIPQHVFNANPELYEQILRESISADQIDAPMSKAIFDLKPAHIITTNFDKLLESSSHPARENYDVIIRDADLLKTKKKQYIIKMHGDIAPENAKEIVLKESDFLQFSQHHVLIELFVKALLADHTILFLGYSMNDYNIKLIISWLNYIRSQNKELLENDTRIGYIVQDSELITNRDVAYFAENHIGIINLNTMPLIDGIPASITHIIGQRLYSFLSVLHNVKLEVVFGREIIYDYAVSFMCQFPYVNFTAIADILHLDRYQFEYGEVTIVNYSDYTSLVSFLSSGTQNAQKLSMVLSSAGVHKLIHHHPYPDRAEEYRIPVEHEVATCTPYLYQLYLHNRYEEICTSLDPINDSQKLFYGILAEGYTHRMHDALLQLDSSAFSASERIAHLINQATWSAFRTWRFDGNAVITCMDNIPSAQTQQVFKPIRDFLSGNTSLRMRINECLKKLIEHYEPRCRVIGGSLGELHKLKIYAYDAYALFFAYHLFFEKTADLRNLLLPYIEGMLLTNGKNTEIDVADYDFPMHRGQKQKYTLNIIDIDMLTKFPKTKELEELIAKHQVNHLLIEKDAHVVLVQHFINLTTSMLHLQTFHDHPLARSFVNYCLLLPLMKLTQEQKTQLSAFLDSLFVDLLFIKNFFTIDFHDWRLALKAISNLISHVGIKANLSALKTLLEQSTFDDYYVNINRYVLSEVLCHLITEDYNQEELGDLLCELPDRRRIQALHLVRRSIKDEAVIADSKSFLQEHFDSLPDDVLIDFVLNEWITLSSPDGHKLISDLLLTAKKQTPGVYIDPDPVQTKLNTIYLFHITGCLTDITALEEIADQHPILQFLLNHEDFDYSSVDFEHYMWKNIARRKEYMQKFIEHKEEIIPGLKQKADHGIASDFEIKVLYGYLLGEESIKLW